MRQRSDCTALVAKGSIRINRQATDKAHALYQEITEAAQPPCT